MATNAIATRKMAYDTITRATVTSINTAAYTDHEYHAFKCSIVEAATSVPTTIGGELHGHTWLLEDDTAYIARAGTSATL